MNMLMYWGTPLAPQSFTGCNEAAPADPAERSPSVAERTPAPRAAIRGMTWKIIELVRVLFLRMMSLHPLRVLPEDRGARRPRARRTGVLSRNDANADFRRTQAEVSSAQSVIHCLRCGRRCPQVLCHMRNSRNWGALVGFLLGCASRAEPTSARGSMSVPSFMATTPTTARATE